MLWSGENMNQCKLLETKQRRELLFRNLLSSFIDGTAIYGLDQNRANQLRSFTGGLLRTR